MFSCEYCKIFKNTYFQERLPTATSGVRIDESISNGYLNERKISIAKAFLNAQSTKKKLSSIVACMCVYV